MRDEDGCRHSPSALAEPTNQRNIAFNLRPQFGRRGEFFLIPQPVADFHFQFPAIKVAVEVEQVGLHPELRRGSRHGRAKAEV